jgi:glycogen phosphorylase
MKWRRCRNSRGTSCSSKATTCRLARRLVSAFDVWLNNPIYPLEASGTSGMKAAINGVINLSVLDGWWGEGFQQDEQWCQRLGDQTGLQHP